MRLRSVLSLMLVISPMALAGCGDDVTDPDGLLDSAEAEAVLRSAEALPLLPAFMDAVDDEAARPAFFRARELWDAGTAIDDPRGAARRRLAIASVAPVLEGSVPPDEWTEARERIDAWMATADAMLQHLAMPAVEARLQAARRQLQRSDAAANQRIRVYYLLLAGSELVETTPRYVARTLAREAETAVREAEGRSGSPVAPAALDRARRLKDWSARAVEEGDYLLAIQRAYYAKQLVEER